MLYLQKYAKLSAQKIPGNAAAKREVLLESCMYALQQTCTADVVCDGFRRSGLVPFSPECALSNVCVANIQLSPGELAELEEARQRRRRNNIGIGGGFLLPEELKARWEERERRRGGLPGGTCGRGRKRCARARHHSSSDEVSITRSFLISHFFFTGRDAY